MNIGDHFKKNSTNMPTPKGKRNKVAEENQHADLEANGGHGSIGTDSAMEPLDVNTLIHAQIKKNGDNRCTYGGQKNS